MNDQVRAGDVTVFPPRPAYRFRAVQGIHSQGGSPITGANPPYGASIDYFLKNASAAGAEITIVGPKGEAVRSFKGPAQAGLNRVWWNLKYDPQKEVKLRTVPADEPGAMLGPDGSRPLITWGRGQVMPPVAPGKYTVKVNVAGREVSEPLTVLKDPNSGWSEQDIAKQVALGLELRGEIDDAVDMINQIEWRRRQLQNMQGMHASEGKDDRASRRESRRGQARRRRGAAVRPVADRADRGFVPPSNAALRPHRQPRAERPERHRRAADDAATGGERRVQAAARGNAPAVPDRNGRSAARPVACRSRAGPSPDPALPSIAIR